MENEHRSYGWSHAREDSSHAYLVPQVKELLAAHARGQGGARARVVDLGCGNGYVTHRLADAGYDVVGIDTSEDGIVAARKAYPDVRFEVASVYDDALAAGGPADAVVALEVGEHLFYPKKLFEKARALLRDGGVLIVSTPYHGYAKNLAISLLDGWDRHWSVGWDGGHIKFFSRRSIERMASEAGLRPVAHHGVGRIPYLWKSMFLVAAR